MRQVLLAAIILVGAAQAVAAEQHRVLLLHSFGPHFPPWNTITTNFREELRMQSPHPLDLYEASVQDERFSDPQYERPFIEYLDGLFGKRNLNLVVAIGAPAARFFLRNRSVLFPTVPLIIAGANARTLGEVALTANDTAVAVAFDSSLLIENILQVLPDTKDIAVAIGDSPLERFWVEDLRRSFGRFSNRVTFHWWNKLSFDEMMKRASELPPGAAIYYGTVRVDARGEPQEEDRVFTRLREIAKAPLFSYVDNHFGDGLVGGPLLSSKQMA